MVFGHDLNGMEHATSAVPTKLFAVLVNLEGIETVMVNTLPSNAAT